MERLKELWQLAKRYALATAIFLTPDTVASFFYTRGLEDAANQAMERVFYRLANMNRELRREFIRNIVKEYKDPDKLPR